MWHKLSIDQKINLIKTKIRKAVAREQYDSALLLIKCLANILLNYNQYYKDDFLEEQLEILRGKLFDASDKPMQSEQTDGGSIFFYDGVGVDDGLELIYVKGLVKAGCHVIYLVRESAKGKFPLLQTWLENYHAEVIYIPTGLSTLEECRYIYEAQNRADIRAGFLYALPYDVAGVMAFMGADNRYIRYRINFVDHAYWLGGKGAFDYCVEFRDVGAFLSNSYRGIPKSDIILLPYYPYIDREKEFEGFPFPVEKGDFIIFSGGTLYKTIDGEENLYYIMVEFCLSEFENTKFWYAGGGENRDAVELKRLQQKYNGRVFWSEGGRNDLFQVLQHVDLYLNTYPVGGGLMLQYAAAAGRIPLIFYRTIEARCLTLLGQEKLGIEFNDLTAWKEEVRKLILDEKYRKMKEQRITNACIDPDTFEKNLVSILEEQKTEYEISCADVGGLQEIQKTYRQRFGEHGIEEVIGKESYLPLLKVCPFIYLYSRMVKRVEEK